MAETAIRKAARTLGKRGGKKGGKARFAKLTAEERSAIARKAAQARWRQEPVAAPQGTQSEDTEEG